jgi:hypothetical protein
MNDKQLIKGTSIMRLWRRGAIQKWLDCGIPLKIAEEIAIGCGECLGEFTAYNRVVTIGKSLIMKLLAGEVATGPNFHAIGTGVNAPSVIDIILTTEVARKGLSLVSRSGSMLVLSVFYLAAEATFNIKEAGIFANGATSTPGSGTLFSHYLQTYDNTAGLVDLTFDYSLQFPG